MTDTAKSSNITDHPFEPRALPIHVIPAGHSDRPLEQIKRELVTYPPNPWLCQGCRLAEAAHRETTVKR